MWTRKRRTWLAVFVALAFAAAYLGGLRRNFNEKSERSLELTDEVTAVDRVLVAITVLKVDPAARQLTARLQFRPLGNIAHDPVSPNTKLKLRLNNSPGEQTFEFPEGTGMVQIEATFPLDGDANKYPFDRYDATLWLFMDTPRGTNQPQSPDVGQATSSDISQTGDLGIGEAELLGNVPVPLSVTLAASTPGIKYTGEVIRSKDFGVTRVSLNLKRADSIINTSITVMCLMLGLALSVLAMVIKAVTVHGKFEVLPLGLAISLIFGLPALRNIQPYVPPVGVLGDYFSFIWAELLVAASAIITALTWVWRSEQKLGSNPDS